MTLLTEITDALSGNIEQDLSGYVVNDLCIQHAPRTILLLESPHVDEVDAGHPLAGRSGKAVTKALKQNPSIRPMLEQIEGANQNNEAIGCILRRCPGTLRLGLMNASRLPLQEKTYRGQEDHIWRNWQLHGEFLCYLQTVRDNPALLSVEAEHRASRVYRVLRNDLKSRLEQLPGDTLIVPCGQVARAFVDVATHLEEYQGAAQIYDQEVLHPSHRHWEGQDGNPTQVVTSLVQLIHDRRLPHA